MKPGRYPTSFPLLHLEKPVEDPIRDGVPELPRIVFGPPIAFRPHADYQHIALQPPHFRIGTRPTPSISRCATRCTDPRNPLRCTRTVGNAVRASAD